MVAEPHAASAGLKPPTEDGRIQRCPDTQRARRPLLLGLSIGAVLWLAIGLFSWQFFR